MIRYTGTHPNPGIDRIGQFTAPTRDALAGAKPKDRLLAWLQQAARTNQPCPSNYEIAERLGLAKTNNGSELLKSLESQKLVVVHRYPSARYVIFPDGSHTKIPEAAKPGRPHHKKKAETAVGASP